MKRRTFLAAAALAPLWLRRAFADTSLGGGAPTTPGSAFAGALAAAKQKGRALVVLVVPDEENQRTVRGQIFGEYIMNASDAQLAPLSRADVVAATPSEMQGAGVSAPKDALLVLIDGNGKVTVSRRDVPEFLYGEGDASDRKKIDRAVDERVERVAQEVTRLLGPRPAVEGSAVAARLRGDRIAGSYWARTSSCGLPTVEGLRDPEVVDMDCGMGFSSPRSARFLYFFAQGPATRYRKRNKL